jgi:DNA-binding IclR family transcriptional regulator
VDAAELLTALRQTREDGIAISDQDVTVGVAAIGVPITDYRGQVRGALSISGIRESILGAELPRWREELIKGGAEISEALGADFASQGLADFG